MSSDRSDGPTRPVHMRDVAELAGVGMTAVSRGLNGKTKVSAENRERALDVIQSLHYVPNHVARSLRQQRSRRIGTLDPDLRDPSFAICPDVIGIRGEPYGLPQRGICDVLRSTDVWRSCAC